jgi:hypothetical protein
VLTVIQLPGDCADWARTDSAQTATNMATQSAASDQASHAETRAFALGTTRLCSLVSSVTTLLYSTTVSGALRQTLRGGVVSKLSKTLSLHAGPCAAYECLSFRPAPPRHPAPKITRVIAGPLGYHRRVLFGMPAWVRCRLEKQMKECAALTVYPRSRKFMRHS